MIATHPDEEAAAQVDQLIPRPMSHRSKFLVGAVLVVGSVALVFAVLTGRLVPDPFGSGNFGGTYSSYVDTDADAVGAWVKVSNYSSRAVRLTDLEVDLPGAEVVDVRTDAGIGVLDSGDAGDWGVLGTETAGLPVVIEPRGSIDLRVWYRPTSCVDPIGPWGGLAGTFDFGDGAFPPISRTVNLPTEMWDGSERVGMLDKNGSVGVKMGAGPLSAACEVLR